MQFCLTPKAAELLKGYCWLAIDAEQITAILAQKQMKKFDIVCIVNWIMKNKGSIIDLYYKEKKIKVRQITDPYWHASMDQ